MTTKLETMERHEVQTEFDNMRWRLIFALDNLDNLSKRNDVKGQIEVVKDRLYELCCLPIQQVKKYLVMANPRDSIAIEFISAHDTYEQAKAVRDQCIEGDDKHDPCEYFIEEKQTTKFTFNDLFEGEVK